MKKLLFAFLAGLFFILGIVSVGAADITLAENGQPVYKIGSSETWLEQDENAAAFADFVKIIEDYTGVDFEFKFTYNRRKNHGRQENCL